MRRTIYPDATLFDGEDDALYIPEEDLTPLQESQIGVCEDFEEWLNSECARACPFVSNLRQDGMTIFFPEDFAALTLEKAGTAFRPYDPKVIVGLIPRSQCPDYDEEIAAFAAHHNENHFGVWLTILTPARLAALGLKPFQDFVIVLFQDIYALEAGRHFIEKVAPAYYKLSDVASETDADPVALAQTAINADVRATALARWRAHSPTGITLFSRLHDVAHDWITCEGRHH